MTKQTADYLKWVERFVDGELSPLESAEFNAALKINPKLVEKVKELQKLDEKISQVFFHFAPPDNFTKSLIKGLPDPKRLLDIPKFGEIAVALKLAKKEQVKEALKQQKELRLQGQDELIGNILLSNGILTESQIRKILITQEQEGKPQILGGCEILEQVGRGGMGVVYKARQLSLSRDVAVKVLYPKLANDDNFVKSFITEGHAVAQLAHPNVVTGIDVGEQDGFIYLLMEFVDGPTLRQWMKKHGTKSEAEVLNIAIQISSALEYAQKLNFIHRDIKPDNIMLDSSGTAKLCDLGLVKKDEEDTLAKKGEVVGTPHYLSPEQARGESDIDSRSDIYSLGATMYHVVTGTTPYSGSNSQQIMEKHAFSDIQEPRERLPELSEGMNAIICKMMTRDRDGRYPSPSELKRDLELLKAGKMPLALQEKLIKEGKLDPNKLIYKDKGPARIAFAFITLALIVAILAFTVNKFASPPETSATPTPTVTTSAKKTTKKKTVKPIKFDGDARKAGEDLERLLGKVNTSKGNYLDIISESSRLITMHPGTSQADRAFEIRKKALEDFENDALDSVEALRESSLTLLEQGKYKDALNIFQKFPEKFTATTTYLNLNETIKEIKKRIAGIVENKMFDAKDLAKKEDFGASEDLLVKLIAALPSEFSQEPYNLLYKISILKNKYVKKEGELAVVRILDLTLDAQFKKAKELTSRFTTDRIFAAYAKEVSEASRFFSVIEEILTNANTRLLDFEGKKLSVQFKNQLEEVSIRLDKVYPDNYYEITIFGDNRGKKKIHISDLSPLTIANLVREDLRGAKKEERSALTLKISIFELFSGRFYEADRDSKEAADLGEDISYYTDLRENFSDLVVNRFALKIYNQMIEAAEKQDWENVTLLAQELLGNYKTGKLVQSRSSNISRLMTRASIATSGISELFKGRLTVDDEANLVFEYDFSDEAQLDDFSFNQKLWKLNRKSLECGVDKQLQSTLIHPAVFSGYCKVEIEYKNPTPNVFCSRVCNWWMGFDSFNKGGGIASSLSDDRGTTFNATGTDFTLEKNKLYKIVFVNDGEKASIIVDGKVILTGNTGSGTSFVEIRDWGNGFINSIKITGKADPIWLNAITSKLKQVKDEEFQAGVLRTEYKDTRFGRRSGRKTVPGISDYFEKGPNKKNKTAVYSLKYEAEMLILEDDEFEFKLTTTARVSIKIDNAELFNNLTSKDPPEEFVVVKLKLKRGFHKVEILVSNDGLEHQVVRLSYSTISYANVKIPPLLFFSQRMK